MGVLFAILGEFMELISATSNNKIKAYISLVAKRKERKEQGLFVLEGLRLCMDAYRSGYPVRELYVTKSALEKNKEEIESLIAISERCYEITDAIAEKMSDTKTPQGVFCVMSFLDKSECSNKIDIIGKYILLENVQDPANLGAISRTAEALGITGLIVSGGCDVYSPKALRASMGALLRLPVIVTENVTETIQKAQKDGMKVFASTPDSSAVSIKDANFSGGVITVIGNEANGVTEDTMNCCDEKITIRMTGKAESLNAGAAASIIMWEMVTPVNGNL